MLPTNTTSPQLGYSVLTPFLKKQDRTIDRVLDGNCFFRALSRQLTGDYHIQLRGIIAQCESNFVELLVCTCITPIMYIMAQLLNTCIKHWYTF